MAVLLHAQQIILIFLLFPLTWAVSFMSLQPLRITDPICRAQYSAEINACSLSDFFSGEGCSVDCIANLNQIQTNVFETCQGYRDAAKNSTILAAVFDGLVVGNLCANVKTLQTITATVTVSSGEQTPSALSTTREVTPSTSLGIGSSTLTVSRLSSGASGLVTDTGRTPTPRALGTTRSPMGSVSSDGFSTSTSTDEPSTSSTDSTITSSPDVITETAVLTRTVFPTPSSQSTTSTSRSGGGGTPFSASSGTHAISPWQNTATLSVTITMMGFFFFC